MLTWWGRTEDFIWLTSDGHVGKATLAAVGRKTGLGAGRRRCRGGMVGNSDRTVCLDTHFVGDSPPFFPWFAGPRPCFLLP